MSSTGPSTYNTLPPPPSGACHRQAVDLHTPLPRGSTQASQKANQGRVLSLWGAPPPWLAGEGGEGGGRGTESVERRTMIGRGRFHARWRRRPRTARRGLCPGSCWPTFLDLPRGPRWPAGGAEARCVGPALQPPPLPAHLSSPRAPFWDARGTGAGLRGRRACIWEGGW